MIYNTSMHDIHTLGISILLHTFLAEKNLIYFYNDNLTIIDNQIPSYT